MLRRLIWVTLAWLSLTAPSGAVAQEETELDRQGRAHFEAARLHFERGAYEEALSEFTAAYELSGRPALLYNLYLTTERLGDFEHAIAYLERYLAEGDPDAERRASLEPRLANLRERRARAAPAETETTEPADAAASTPAPSQGGDMVPAAIAFGIGGAGLVTFAIFGGLALAEDDALAASCGVSCSDAQLSWLGTSTLVADIGWVTALVGAAVGTVLALTVGMPSGGDVALAPSFSPEGGGVSAAGRF